MQKIASVYGHYRSTVTPNRVMLLQAPNVCHRLMLTRMLFAGVLQASVERVVGAVVIKLPWPLVATRCVAAARLNLLFCKFKNPANTQK